MSVLTTIPTLLVHRTLDLLMPRVVSQALATPPRATIWVYVCGGHGGEPANQAGVGPMNSTAAPLAWFALSSVWALRHQVFGGLTLKALALPLTAFPLKTRHLARSSHTREEGGLLRRSPGAHRLRVKLCVLVGYEGDGLSVLKPLAHTSKVHIEPELVFSQLGLETPKVQCMRLYRIPAHQALAKTGHLSVEMGAP